MQHNKLFKSKYSYLLACFFCIFILSNIKAQKGSNDGISLSNDGIQSPHESALLHLISEDKGVLLPRMDNSQRYQIKTPTEGLLIYNTESDRLEIYLNDGWYYLGSEQIGVASGTATPGSGGFAISSQLSYEISPSAILDIESYEKGFLLPRTSDINSSPADGLIFYDTSTNKLKFYNNTEWKTPCHEFINSDYASGTNESDGMLITDQEIADPNDAHHSAIVEIRTVEGKGLLIPAVTSANRDNLAPEQGLIIYNATDKKINYTDGSYWYEIIDYIPSQPGEISGDENICEDATGLEYSISEVAGTTTYNWSVPGGWTITSGQGTTTINADASSTSGNVSVTAENACGESASRDLYVNVDEILTADNTTDDNDLCDQTTRNLSGSPAGGDWSIVSGPGSITGAEYTADGTGTVIIRYTVDAGECPTTTDDVEFEVVDVPDAPTEGSHDESSTEIVWNWDAPTEGFDVVGYYWHDQDELDGNEIDRGSNTSYTETGLDCEESYTRYVWAYNDCGVSDMLTITGNTDDCSICGEDFGDPCDGVTSLTYQGFEYNTVAIGEQCWLVEDLRATEFRNGNAIPKITNNTTWGSRIGPAYDIYPHSEIDGIDSEEEVLEKYGATYNWYVVEDNRGICPEGWTVPSHDQWSQLEQFSCFCADLQDRFPSHENDNCGASDKYPYDETRTGYATNWDYAGVPLKSTRTADRNVGDSDPRSPAPLEPVDLTDHPRWKYDPNYYGTDEYGFNALPLYFRYGTSSGTWLTSSDPFRYGYWWTSTEETGGDLDFYMRTKESWNRRLVVTDGSSYRWKRHKRYGMNIRCIKEDICPDGPGVPTNINITPGLTTADISWSPGSPDGSPYTVTYLWTIGLHDEIDYEKGARGVAHGYTTDTSVKVGGLMADETYYFRVRAMYGCDNSLTDYVTQSFTTDECGDYSIGDRIEGGVLVHIDTDLIDGQCGFLISALAHEGTGNIQSTTSDVEDTSTDVGTGKNNTQLFVDEWNTGTAISGCNNKTTSDDYNTYNDWFLPSLDELVEICNNNNHLDSWSSSQTYWSSSQNSTNTNHSMSGSCATGTTTKTVNRRNICARYLSANSLPYSDNIPSSRSVFPHNWGQEITGLDHNRWYVSETNLAGMASNEMRIDWTSPTMISSSTDVEARLILPPLNTVGVEEIEVEFRHRVSKFGGCDYHIKLQTSSDGVNWTTEWEVENDSNIPAEWVTISGITSNLGGHTYIAWYYEGDLYNLGYWVLDNFSVEDTTP